MIVVYDRASNIVRAIITGRPAVAEDAGRFSVVGATESIKGASVAAVAWAYFPDQDVPDPELDDELRDIPRTLAELSLRPPTPAELDGYLNPPYFEPPPGTGIPEHIAAIEAFLVAQFSQGG